MPDGSGWFLFVIIHFKVGIPYFAL